MAPDSSSYLSPVWSSSLFTDRVVFCTGGAGTICSAQVRALVHLGANACIIGRNVDKTVNAAKDIATCRSGAKVIGIGGVDVRDPAAVAKAVERCVAELGAVDYLIAGAAGNFVAPISKLSSNAFKSVIDIDVLGSYNALKPCLPHLVASAEAKRGGGVIFVSATFHYTGFPLQGHVAAAKAAVDALSANVAIEYGPLGVRSNVIAPGPIADTEGMRRLVTLNASGAEGTAQSVPLGRMGEVRDISDATVYLFSEAAKYVNGHVLVVDGGAWRTMASGNAETGSYPAMFKQSKL